MQTTKNMPKPSWLKIQLPHGQQWHHVEQVLASQRLHTVCDEARCPNKGECWGAGTATFMIMGDVCTRKCRFCAVRSARHGVALDPTEPERLAYAITSLGLSYIVITSVDRDDLPDRGAQHFGACIHAVRVVSTPAKVEVLIPDYIDAELQPLFEAKPDIIAHNIETVSRLQSVRDRRASFQKSLETLRQASSQGIPTKSSLLLGLGETDQEVMEVLEALREVGVSIIVMGQYLQPSRHEIPVSEYVSPDTFAVLGQRARALGFSSVISAPFARTSYHAEQAWNTTIERGGL